LYRLLGCRVKAWQSVSSFNRVAINDVKKIEFIEAEFEGRKLGGKKAL